MKTLIFALCGISLIACGGDDGATMDTTPDTGSDVETVEPKADAAPDAKSPPMDAIPTTQTDTMPPADTMTVPPADTMAPPMDTMPQTDPERSPPLSCQGWRSHAIKPRACIVIKGASYWLSGQSIDAPGECTLKLDPPTNETVCFHNKFQNTHYRRTKEAGGNMVIVRITESPTVANCPCL